LAIDLHTTEISAISLQSKNTFKMLTQSPHRASRFSEYNNSMALQLNPWKDGYIETRRLLQNNVFNTKTVKITFSESEFFEYLKDDDAVALFEAIGSTLPRLESVIIKLKMSSELPSLAIPPIQALTSLLVAENKVGLQCLALIGLSMEGNDLDMNGLIEALRIHPSLNSVVLKECSFSRPQYLQKLRTTLTTREGMKHCGFVDNFVVERNRSLQLRSHLLFIISLLVISMTLIFENSMSGEILSSSFAIDSWNQIIGSGTIVVEERRETEKSEKKRKGLWRRKGMWKQKKNI
jgi:hypothetical protein